MYQVIEKVNGMLDWLTPEKLKSENGEHSYVRLFLLSHIFTPVAMVPVLMFLYTYDPQPFPHITILVISGAAFWLFPFAVKYLVLPYSLLVKIALQNLIFFYTVCSYYYGGLSSPFLMWLPCVPLMGALYLGLGIRSQLIILCQLIVSFGMFYMVCLQNPSSAVHIAQSEMAGLVSISMAVAIAFMFVLGNSFSRAVNSQVALQREMERQRTALQKLTNEKVDAERANSAKSEFLAKMSHELRTPLNAVLGYSEILLEDAELDGRTDEIADLQKISAAGKHLLAMVNDILDISKIEAGKAELYLETFSLSQFAKEVEATARPLAAKNTNSFVMKRGGNLGSAHMDATKLRQSVLNLLSNAAKFTDNGQITLTIERVPKAEGDWLSISVRDTGVGISEDNMKNLFHNFSQANSSITTKFGGTGLGLSLSRNLCQMMGGHISLESKLGHGSCFTIHLPVEVEAQLDAQSFVSDEEVDLQADEAKSSFGGGQVDIVEPVTEAELDEAIAGLRSVHEPAKRKEVVSEPINSSESAKTVLVIDDDGNFLDVAERLLNREGYKAITSECPEAVLQLAMTYKPDAIMLDVLMPSLDGWDVLATLKSEPATAHIPVTMISNVADREKARRHNAAGFVEKPLDSEKLRILLEPGHNKTAAATG